MLNNTLSVGKIEEGFVLDHIQAGRSMDIYKYLHLDKLDCCVAIIKNAKSSKMGKKDIMKIECPIDFMDLDILGFIDHNITVNIIKDSQDRRQESTSSSEEDHKCDPLQKSALHYFYRAGTGSCLRTD